MPYPAHITRADVFKVLQERFNLDELKQLCFTLVIDYENLAGESKDAKARELVLFFERHANEADLIAAIAHERPGVLSTPSTPATTQPPPTPAPDLGFNLGFAMHELRSRLAYQAPYALPSLERLDQFLQSSLASGPGLNDSVRRVLIQLNQLSHLHLGKTLPELSGYAGHYLRGPLGDLARQAEALWARPPGRERTQALEELVKQMHYAACFAAVSDMQATISYTLQQRQRGETLAVIAWLETFPDQRFIPDLLAVIQANEQPFNTYHATLALVGILRRYRVASQDLQAILAATASGSGSGDGDRDTTLRQLRAVAEESLKRGPSPTIAVADFSSYDKHGGWPTSVNKGLVLGTLTEALKTALRRHLWVGGQPVQVVSATHMPYDQRADLFLQGEVNVYEIPSGIELHLRFTGSDYGSEPTVVGLPHTHGPELQTDLERIAYETVRAITPGIGYKLPGVQFKNDG